jgi:hypothetical protein
MTCANSFSAAITVSNTGLATINNLTVTPSIDAVAQAPIPWTGNLLAGATTTIVLSNITATAGGGHAFSYVITGDAYTVNNSGSGKIYLAANYQTTPVAEGFVSGTFPPAKWNVFNSDNGPAWSRNTAAGSYSIWPLQSIKYDFYNNTVIGDKDELYLPPMDLSGAADPVLDFDLAYAQRNSTSDDKLEVFASDDCGDTWVSVYSNSGISLSTSLSEAPFDLTYDLLSSDKWRTESVTLPGFNKNEVLVKFVTTSDNGSSLYLDNINLSQKNPTGVNKVAGTLSGAIVYPNPAAATANIRIQANTSGNGNISVVNTLGQIVFKKDVSIEAGSNVVEMDTRSLATGVYHVIIRAENSTVTKKLTISK